MAIQIGSGITIGGGIGIGAAAGGGGGGLISASSLSSILYHVHYSPTLYFLTQGAANQFYAANPSTYYVVEYDGTTQTKYDGVTIGAVTPNGPYWEVTASGGTITVGTYLSNASQNVYF